MDDAPDFDLPADHPGVADAQYRRRRAAISQAADGYVDGAPIPTVEYTEEEDEVWRVVSAELRRKHERLASAAYLEGAARLDLRRDHVPQLEEVSSRLHDLTGFRLRPTGGLVPTRIFYGSLADRVFWSTQYVRHHSVPFYTPEPDIIHEVIGHANMLAEPELADLYQLAGEASRRAESEQALEFFSRVFWFSLEFGVLWEQGELRTYGAGLLSSYAEIELFRQAEVRPLDVTAMGTTAYDITRYQPLLFAAESFEQAYRTLSAFFASYDDAAFERLVHTSRAS